MLLIALVRVDQREYNEAKIEVKRDSGLNKLWLKFYFCNLTGCGHINTLVGPFQGLRKDSCI